MYEQSRLRVSDRTLEYRQALSQTFPNSVAGIGISINQRLQNYESVENSARRVDLIKWTHDGLFSVADLRKDTGKLEISEVPETDELEAYKYFYKTYWSFVVSA